MVDVPSLLAFSAIETTIAELDALLSREANRKAADFAKLASAVNGLNTVLAAEVEPVQGGRGPTGAHPPGQDGSTPSPAPIPFVALPRRTTHGGRFGPAVRKKLIAEALEQGGW